MADTQSTREAFTRYASLIASQLQPKTFSPESESAVAVQVERGGVLPLALTSDDLTLLPPRIDRVLELSTSPRLRELAIVDRTGHHRPVYRSLLGYACLKTFQHLYERLPRADFGRWEEGL